jgi:hypothetical protein
MGRRMVRMLVWVPILRDLKQKENRKKCIESLEIMSHSLPNSKVVTRNGKDVVDNNRRYAMSERCWEVVIEERLNARSIKRALRQHRSSYMNKPRIAACLLDVSCAGTRLWSARPYSIPPKGASDVPSLFVIDMKGTVVDEIRERDGFDGSA